MQSQMFYSIINVVTFGRNLKLIFITMPQFVMVNLLFQNAIEKKGIDLNEVEKQVLGTKEEQSAKSQ